MKHILTPLEVMLDNMRFAHEEAEKVLKRIITIDEGTCNLEEGLDLFRELMGFRSMAQAAAKDAAPYMHPKLTAIAAKIHAINDLDGETVGTLSTSELLHHTTRLITQIEELTEGADGSGEGEELSPDLYKLN